MIADQFNWQEMLILVGGVVFLALVQTGLMLQGPPDPIGTLMINAIFGTL
jgi:hypothetical protein